MGRNKEYSPRRVPSLSLSFPICKTRASAQLVSLTGRLWRRKAMAMSCKALSHPRGDKREVGVRTSPPAAVVLASSWGGVCRAHRAAAATGPWVQLRPPVHKHDASKATVECMEHAQVCACADTHVCACAAVLTPVSSSSWNLSTPTSLGGLLWRGGGGVAGCLFTGPSSWLFID